MACASVARSPNRPGGEIAIGAVYATLERLQDKVRCATGSRTGRWRPGRPGATFLHCHQGRDEGPRGRGRHSTAAVERRPGATRLRSVMIVACARALLAWLLPPDARAMIVRDLDDEYERFIDRRARERVQRVVSPPGRGSLIPAIRMRRRRVRVFRRRSRSRGRGIWRDTRLAVRLARRQKSFTLAVLVTLGLGIGATTAVFSVVDPVLLRQLPDADPVVAGRIWSANPRGIARNSVSPPDFSIFGKASDRSSSLRPSRLTPP